MYDEEAELNEAEIASLDDINKEQESGSETSDDEMKVLSYNCPFCQKLFSEKDDVINYIEESTEAMDENDINNDENRIFCCPYCDEKFDSENNVFVHMDSY